MLLKCSKCGNEISIGASYCPKCGDKEPFKDIELQGEVYDKLSKAERHNFSKLGGKRKYSKCENIVSYSIMALILIVFAYNVLKPKSPEELVQEKKEAAMAQKSWEKSEALAFCEIKLKDKLNDPDSFKSGEYIVLRQLDGTLKVIEDFRAKKCFWWIC